MTDRNQSLDQKIADAESALQRLSETCWETAEENRVFLNEEQDVPSTADSSSCGDSVHSSQERFQGTIKKRIDIEWGRKRIPMTQLGEIASGSILTLDKNSNTEVDLFIGGQRVARGELLVQDEKIAVQITQVFS